MSFPRDEARLQGQCFVDEWVDIEASPEQIWPWLAQMGNGRAGWYSYDWLDNLGKKSFTFIDSSLIEISKDQKIPFALISEVETNRLLTYQFGSWASMTYFLEVLSGQRTRLWTRARFKDPGWFLKALIQRGHLFMQEKQFQELKKRVETLARVEGSLRK